VYALPVGYEAYRHREVCLADRIVWLVFVVVGYGVRFSSVSGSLWVLVEAFYGICESSWLQINYVWWPSTAEMCIYMFLTVWRLEATLAVTDNVGSNWLELQVRFGAGFFFYFLTPLTRARHWTLSWATSTLSPTFAVCFRKMNFNLFFFFTKNSIQVGGTALTFRNMPLFYGEGLLDSSPARQTGILPLVGYPLLFYSHLPPYLEAVSSMRNVRRRHTVVWNNVSGKKLFVFTFW
jgi:hypothetical protein